MVFLVLSILSALFLYPLFFILNNSFKGKFFISSDPFSLPLGDTFSGLTNYITGLTETGLFGAMGWSL